MTGHLRRRPCFDILSADHPPVALANVLQSKEKCLMLLVTPRHCNVETYLFINITRETLHTEHTRKQAKAHLLYYWMPAVYAG